MKNGRKGMNKFLTALLCAAVTTVFSVPSFADTEGDVPEEETTVVAKIADAEYRTLAEAVSAAKGGDVIKLQADTAENITIPEAKRLTLDLGTATISNDGGHTITNHGTLTIKGSGTVTNTVDNKGTLVNDGTVIFKGGTLTRSDDEDNTWYIIKNMGDLTVSGGHVIQPESESSAIINVEDCNSTLTFDSGSVEAGRIAVKNETTAVINGGTFAAEETVLNWGDIEIHGGTYNGYVATWGYDDNTTVPRTLIDGENIVINALAEDADNLAIGAIAYGQIQDEKNWPTVQVKNANVNGVVAVGSYDTNTKTTDFDTKYQNTQASITVSGGNYTEKVDDVFLAENKVLIDYKGTGDYKYTVHQHDWNAEPTVDKKATCTEEGSQSIHCKSCDATKDAEVIQATGHTFTHKVEKAGALKNGSEYDICSKCQVKKNVKKLAGYAEYVVKGYKVGKGKKAFTAKWTKASAANQKKMDGYQIRYSLKSSMAGAKMKTAAKTSKSKKISKLKSKKKYYVQVRTYKKSNGVTYYSKWSGKKTVKTR